MSPNTLDELLDHLPALRKLRSLNADWLRILLDRPARHCTWCGQRVGKYRSTWCSDACVEAFRARCCKVTQARLVSDRDHGICQECGRDTLAAERDAEQAVRDALAARRLSPYSAEGREIRHAIVSQFGYARSRWREVDHIIPVVESGGLCGIDNLRLICGACHLAATSRLAGRRR
jgi:hypothetical protein